MLVPVQWDNFEMIRNRARKQWAESAWVARVPEEVLVAEEAWALVVESPEDMLASVTYYNRDSLTLGSRGLR